MSGVLGAACFTAAQWEIKCLSGPEMFLSHRKRHCADDIAGGTSEMIWAIKGSQGPFRGVLRQVLTDGR